MTKLNKILMVSVAAVTLAAGYAVAEDNSNVLNNAVDTVQDTVNSTVDTTQSSGNGSIASEEIVLVGRRTSRPSMRCSCDGICALPSLSQGRPTADPGAGSALEHLARQVQRSRR